MIKSQGWATAPAQIEVFMKNRNWQQWTAIGIIAAVIIAAIVLHLVQPQVSYAFLEVCAAVTFVLGVAVGLLLKKSQK